MEGGANEFQQLGSHIAMFTISTSDKVEKFLSRLKKMLETKSSWIWKEMVVLGRTLSASFNVQLLLPPLMLNPQKGERASHLNHTWCSQRDLLP